MMNWNAFHYTIPLWFTMVFSIGMAIYIFKRRSVPGAVALFIMCSIMGLWSFGYIMEILSQGLTAKIFWDNVQMLGGAMGASSLAFALQYTGQEAHLKKRVWVLLATEPLIMWSLAVSNLTELFRSNVYLYTEGPFPALMYEMGTASWIDFGYGYIMYLLFVILIVKFLIHSHSLYRKQAVVIMIGLTTIAGGFILSFLGFFPEYMRDPSPYTFTILNISLFFCIYRYRILKVVPIARETLFEKLNHGLIVLDTNKLIVDINLSAQTIIDITANKAIGKSVEMIFPDITENIELIVKNTQKNMEISLINADEEYIYEIEILPLFNKKNAHIGWLIVIHDITEHKNLEKALQASEEKYRNVSEFANDGIVILQDGYVRYLNRKLLDMINYSYQEVISHAFDKFIIPEFSDQIMQYYRDRMAGENVNSRYETTLLCKEGNRLEVEVNAALMNYDGRLAVLGYIRDITERKRAEKALHTSEQQLNDMFEKHSAIMYTADPNTLKIINANLSAEKFYGYSREELMNMTIFDLNVRSELELREEIDKAVKENRTQYVSKHKLINGEIRDVEISSTRIRTLGDKELYYDIVHDITDRKLAQAALQELAVKDPLTQIYNRRHFFMLAQKEFERCRDNNYSMCAVMIDIDHFKKVNDNYGHAVGDGVLCDVAKKIVDSVKNTGTACRYGGEEFAVFFPETDINEAQVIADKIRKNIMSSPVDTDKGKISVTASVGVSRIINDDNVDKLFDRADRALYNAKQNGRNNVRVYD